MRDMRHRTRRRLLRFTIVLCAAVTTFGAAEMVARAKLVTMPYAPAIWAQNEPNTHPDILRIQYSTDTVPIAQDFDGQYIHVHNHERVTVGTPAHAAHRLYLFGNSMAFDYGVDDAHTLASQLQAMLPEYDVHNMGVLGVGLEVSAAQLRTVALHRGDVVLFYGGTADLAEVYAPVENRYTFPICNFNNNHLAWLALMRLGCQYFQDEPARAMLNNPAAYHDTLVQELDSYHKAIATARQYTASAGASFYALQQPIISTVPLSVREYQLVYGDPDGAGRTAIYMAAYSQFSADIDLTNVLDAARLHGTEVYSDRAHLNDAGNAIVARAIYGAIWRTF